MLTIGPYRSGLPEIRPTVIPKTGRSSLFPPSRETRLATRRLHLEEPIVSPDVHPTTPQRALPVPETAGLSTQFNLPGLQPRTRITSGASYISLPEYLFSNTYFDTDMAVSKFEHAYQRGELLSVPLPRRNSSVIPATGSGPKSLCFL